MVVLEMFLASGLYTAGSVARYFMLRQRLEQESHLQDVAPPQADHLLQTKDNTVKKFVELSVEDQEYHPPMYIGPHTSGVSVGIPLGGGTRYEMRNLLSAAVGDESKDSYYNWRTTDMERAPCATPTLYWLNTADDMKNFFDGNKIPQNIVPLRLPVQVREVKVPPTVQKLYSVPAYHILGTNRAAVIRAAARAKTLDHRFFVPAAVMATFTGFWVWGNWDEYHARMSRERMKQRLGLL